MDGYDNEIDLFFTTKLDTKRWKAKKVEKRKPVFSEEEKKKKAAIECLTAVSDEVIPVTCNYPLAQQSCGGDIGSVPYVCM